MYLDVKKKFGIKYEIKYQIDNCCFFQ